MLSMLTIFTVPSASTLIASTTEYASPLFNEYSNLVLALAIGLPVAVMGVLWLIRSLNKASRRVLGGGRKGRRGRRRR